MAGKRERSVWLRASLLDRLLAPPAPPPGAAALGGATLGAVGERELREALARDLEALLATRRWLPAQADELPEAVASIWGYGLPDLGVYSWRCAADSQALARLLERVIRSFEPRLRPDSVRVTPLPAASAESFRLRFRIDAVLQLEPPCAPVAFETDVDLSASAVRVRSGD